jgi:hypothetical protein
MFDKQRGKDDRCLALADPLTVQSNDLYMQPRHADSNILNRATSPGRANPATAPAQAKAAEPKPKESRQKGTGQQKPTEFSLNAPQASSVCIAGSFNNWDIKHTPMRRNGEQWKARIPLAPGRYEYRFVVDGQWITDPSCKETVSNDYGSTNSVLVI